VRSRGALHPRVEWESPGSEEAAKEESGKLSVGQPPMYAPRQVPRAFDTTTQLPKGWRPFRRRIGSI
jgi:hypothetical protein